MRSSRCPAPCLASLYPHCVVLPPPSSGHPKVPRLSTTRSNCLCSRRCPAPLYQCVTLPMRSSLIMHFPVVPDLALIPQHKQDIGQEGQNAFPHSTHNCTAPFSLLRYRGTTYQQYTGYKEVGGLLELQPWATAGAKASSARDLPAALPATQPNCGALAEIQQAGGLGG